MRVERLALKDFKSYHEAELDLSNVTLASVVGANGAGKSSLLEAVVFALSGGRQLRALDSFVRRGAEECRVTLEFSLSGQRYRLTRTRSTRNSGKSTLELARQEGGLWVAEGSGIKDTEQRVSRLLAVDEEILLLTSVVSQEDAGAFFRLAPGQRLEGLARILQLGATFDPLREHFKVRADAAKANLEQARRDVERLEADALRLYEREQELVDQETVVMLAEDHEHEVAGAVVDAQTEVVIARHAAAGYELAVAKRDELLAGRRRLAEQLHVCGAERNELVARIGQRADLEMELAGRGDLEAARALELRNREQDQATESERGRLTDAVTAAEATLQQARSDWKAADLVYNAGRREQDRAVAELTRLAQEYNAVAARLAAVEDAESPVCDRCGQPVAEAARGRTLAGIQAELEAAVARVRAGDRRVGELADAQPDAERRVQELADRGREAGGLLANLRAELLGLPAPIHNPLMLSSWDHELAMLAEIPAKLATIATLEERLVVVQGEAESLTTAMGAPEAVDALARAEQAVGEAQGARTTVVVAEGSVRTAEAALTAARRSLSEAERAAARLEGEVSSLAPCREQLAKANAAVKAHEGEQADAELLKQAFGKWGVPALIVGNVLLALEGEVNELLALYDGGLAVRFESERETRDGARESLEILVYDGRDWRAYETFSGGERYRVASAMRLGLARLLAHRSGARVETLIVDEPEGLDVAGRAHLARILESLSDDFGLILLLTHYDDLKEAMPQQIVVSRGEDGLSRVEVVG